VSKVPQLPADSPGIEVRNYGREQFHWQHSQQPHGLRRGSIHKEENGLPHLGGRLSAKLHNAQQLIAGMKLTNGI
jgi:hypothetical protein